MERIVPQMASLEVVLFLLICALSLGWLARHLHFPYPVALQAERQELLRIWRDDQISDEVLHQIEEDLDYLESHL